MMHYLNNCRNFSHADFYSSDAFFDLNKEGADQKYIGGFNKGDLCVVLSVGHKKSKNSPEALIKIQQYRFESMKQHDITEANGNISRVVVLCGPLMNSELLPKSAAAIHPRYRILFNKVGQFKQLSVKRDA